MKHKNLQKILDELHNQKTSQPTLFDLKLLNKLKNENEQLFKQKPGVEKCIL